MEQKKEMETYLEERVNVLLKPLLKEILVNKPENVCDFITSWC